MNITQGDPFETEVFTDGVLQPEEILDFNWEWKTELAHIMDLKFDDLPDLLDLETFKSKLITAVLETSLNRFHEKFRPSFEPVADANQGMIAAVRRHSRRP